MRWNTQPNLDSVWKNVKDSASALCSWRGCIVLLKQLVLQDKAKTETSAYTVLHVYCMHFY